MDILGKNGNFKSILDSVSEGVYFTDTKRIIRYWNTRAKNITGYQSQEIIGKSCREDILVHIDEKGSKICDFGLCPILQAQKQKKKYTVNLYLTHKNGYRIPVTVTTIPMWDNNSKYIGTVEVFRDNSEKTLMLSRIGELENMSFLDPLTNIGNRRFIGENMHKRIKEFKRYHIPFGILFIDIDDFKSINDRFGHNQGDVVLKMVANTMVHNLRPFDTVGRWGGEEFVALIVNIADKDLQKLAEKFRMLIAKSSLRHKKQPLKVTISIGGTIAKKNDSVKSLVTRADKLMYKSKTSGKNRVTIK